MQPNALLDHLHKVGLTVSIQESGGLWVEPAARLTDDIRALIRANKPALLQALADQTAAQTDKPAVMSEHQAAGLAQAVIRHVSAPPSPKPLPWNHIDADWRPLAAAYHAHHFGCQQCIGAGQGRGLRCGVGTALSYDSHPAFD